MTTLVEFNNSQLGKALNQKYKALMQSVKNREATDDEALTAGGLRMMIFAGENGGTVSIDDMEVAMDGTCISRSLASALACINSLGEKEFDVTWFISEVMYYIDHHPTMFEEMRIDFTDDVEGYEIKRNTAFTIADEEEANFEY